MSYSPFLGVYRTRDGKYVDMFSGQTITRDQIKPNMAPFNGLFLDKDGKERGLEEISGAGGTVRWFATTAARDAYFTATPDALKEGISVGVGDPVTAYTYDGAAWLEGALAFQGPPGPAGGGASYTHTQTTPAAVWQMQHNLGGLSVNFLIVDGAGEQVIGQTDIQASTSNLLVIRFSEPITGTAYINL